MPAMSVDSCNTTFFLITIGYCLNLYRMRNSNLEVI